MYDRRISIAIYLLQVYFWHLLEVVWGWTRIGTGLHARHLLQRRVVEDAHAGRVELLIHRTLSIEIIHFATSSIPISIDLNSVPSVLKLLLRAKQRSAIGVGEDLLFRECLRSNLLAQGLLQPQILLPLRIQVPHLQRRHLLLHPLHIPARAILQLLLP